MRNPQPLHMAFKSLLLCAVCFFCCVYNAYAQPANDNCSSPETITISNNGFGTGTFTSSSVNIGQATIQTGETFAPAILVAGQNQKSVWFKFKVGSTRKIRVTLQQPGSVIQAGDVGFAVYKTTTCLPATTALSTQLTPIATFGNTFHPCTDGGDYLVQVSSKAATTGLIYIQVEVDFTGATYDRMQDAYQFGSLGAPVYTKNVEFPVECQSLDDASELCYPVSTAGYTKSTWHTFTTPAYLDWLSVILSAPSGSTGGTQIIGYRLYKGNARTAASLSALVPVNNCDSFSNINGYWPPFKTYKCGDLDPGTTYSIQLFYKQDFNQSVRLTIAYGGTMPTKAPEPILANMGANQLGTLASSGTAYNYIDYFACNSRHSIHPCGNALPAAGISFNNVTYNLSTFYTFTLAASANINLNAGVGSCNYPYPLIRLYQQAVTGNCADLSNANLINSGTSNLNVECLMPGTYTVQIMGQEAPITGNNYSLSSSNLTGSSQLCMLSSFGQRVDFSIRVTAATALNQFALQAPGAYDKINAVGGMLSPLQSGVTYQATTDVFGCGPTVLPDTICYTTHNKAMYREFAVADSGLVTFTNKKQNFYYKLFKGDANALADQQNRHSYPQRITGMTPGSNCLTYFYNTYDEDCRPDRVCVLPGTYTFTTFASSTNYINVQDNPKIKFDTHVSKHNTPVLAQNMGSILDSSVAARTSDIDYFSCTDNAVPINGYQPCAIASNVPATKAIYRQFYLRAESIVSISGLYDCAYNSLSSYTNNKTLFSGKATDGLAGLQALPAPWRCFSVTQSNTCTTLPAGWYTVVSYGAGASYQNPLNNAGPNNYSYANMIGFKDQFTITVTPSCPGEQFNRPYRASVNASTNQPYVVDWPARFVTAPSVTLAAERYNCSTDLPFVSGLTACTPTYNRASFYVFRVVQTTSVQVLANSGFSLSLPFSIYPLDIRTDSALLPTTAPVASCNYTGSGSQVCSLQPGVYTLVLFASGSQNCATITPVLTKPCNDPLYNRPYKAAIDAATSQPFLVDYGPGTGHTGAYPVTNKTITLPVEYFTCKSDTPFSSHPILPCNPLVTKLAYYVFKTVRETYVQINTQGQWSAVFPIDVRTDSASLITVAPVQPCVASYGYIQLCRLPAGTYTLVVSPIYNYSTCISVTPTIYVDQPGYSRFDRAAKAYDFGNVPTDNIWHNGRTGDVNPLDPTRAPSNDFIYCTTGASSTDPTDGACYTLYNPRVYSDTSRYLFNSSSQLRPARRNLWYTFVATQGGTIKVKVENKSPDKQQYRFRYTIYKSNVDGTLPFNTVVSTGQVDSTNAQGLTPIITNIGSSSYYCYDGLTEISFFRPPCSAAPERYYVLIESPGGNYNSSYYETGMPPNSQVEVSVLVNPVSVTPTLFDHYSQAGNLGNVGTGTYTGATDNFTCATRDATDPIYDYSSTGASALSYCTKNIWYKFTTTVTGNILYRVSIGGANSYTGYTDVQLFRQTVPGDSTSVGLKFQNPASTISEGGYTWSQLCITPGTYYLLLPGCYRQNENVYPQIKIMEQAGDFCSAPVVATLNGAGMATASAIVNCHTIGTDYGEFNPMLTCPANTPTSTYKSTWYRLDITGNDTLDVTAYLNENTSASSAQIKYRMMTGNCGAMQEQSCVLDALTQNTYKCLGPGSYFFQVFSPVAATGSIDLKLNAVHHADTCAPFNNCLANANFLHQFDCNTVDSVRFINYSTYGSDIRYSWSFGYNGQTSTEVSPSFLYPALTTSQTYNVKLVARNIGCNKADSVTIPITIQPRPYVNLGNDTAVCNGNAIVLNATSHPGATYQWNNGATTPTFTTNIISSGWVSYSVRVTYNGCTRRDTIRVFRNTIVGRNQNKTICTNDSVQLVSNRGIGETYQWSTGAITGFIYTSIPGTYYCDVKINGCVKRDTFNVAAAGDFSFGADTGVCIRPGRPYILNATTAGAISYLWQNGSTNATYNVTAPGQFWVKINFGNCFVQDTINLSNMQAIVRSNTASLCAGRNYILPSGAVVNIPGIYSDTARAVGGCDSLISTTTLVLKSVSTQNSTASICQGQNYTLPWGASVSTAGNYRDTLRSPTDGCDSIIRTVALIVVSPVLRTSNISICAGQTYTLPSGVVVSTGGNYRDTVRYVSGCDSLITTLQLAVRTVQTATSNHSICPGQLFTLPSGRVVNTAGTFYDTLHYTSGGCDSIRYTINLVIGVPATTTLNAFVCTGVPYILPSGRVVNTAGTYHDTLHHVIGGCDSIHYTIIVANRQVATASISVAICAGQNYMLPSGTVVNTTGVYKDTLRYTEGCDSLINTFTISTRNVITRNLAASVCAGHSYTLPSGLVVNNAGIYKDTLRYVAGCDSIITTINLQVAQISNAVLNPVICQGQSYSMPSGKIIYNAGIYKDTLRSNMGCDSVITNVTLTTTPKPAMGINPSVATVCEGDSLQLKAYGGATYRWIQGNGILSPTAANTWIYPPVAGAYKVIISEPVCNSNDTIQSIVRIETLPQISITKTHDVTCIQGAAQLTARGGNRYIWWPATGLTSNTISNPLAAPVTTTTYHVQAISSRNCVAEDSIEVKVIKGDAGEGYLVPSAFTPNNDGNNDCFGIRTWGTVTNLQFTVFDRFGVLVFSTSDATKCWDGKYKGEPLAPAAFIYFIKANTVCGPIERKGTVVLIR